MKKRKLTILALIVAMLIVSTVGAFASEVNIGGTGYINFKKYCVPGTDYYSETNTGAYLYTKENGKLTYLRMMYLSDTNTGVPRTDKYGNPIWAYCIEYGQEVNSTNVRTADTPGNTAQWQALGTERQQGISLAALYAPTLKIEGTSEADMYAATQAVIWEYQTGVRTSTTSNSKSDATYKGKTIEANRFEKIFNKSNSGLKAYDSLISHIYSHRVLPKLSTTAPVLTFDKTEKLYKTTITDQSGILSQFNVTTANKDIRIQKSGTALTLMSKQVVSPQTISFQKIMPKTTAQPLLVLSPGVPGQITVVGQSTVEVKTSITATVKPLVIPTYKIGIIKEGEVLSHFTEEEIELLNKAKMTLYSPKYENQHLSECQVEIYAKEDVITEDGVTRYHKGDLIQTLTTTEKETVYSKPLYVGSYIIKEVTAPEGYIKNEKEIEVTLSTQDEIVTIQNEREKKTFQFTKTYEQNNKEQNKETYFGVYNKHPINDLQKDSLLAILQPDEDGLCKLTEDLPLNQEYYIKELMAPDGYILDETIYDMESLNNQQIENKLLPPPPPSPVEPVIVLDETPLAPAPPAQEEIPLTMDANENPIFFLALFLISGVAIMAISFHKNKRAKNIC